MEKYLYKILKYGSPLVLVIAPLLMLYGFIFPWVPAQDELSKYNDKLILLIGVELKNDKQGKSYLIIDNEINSKTVNIYSYKDGTIEVSKSNGGLLLIFVFYIIIILLTCWFWLWPHNKPLKNETAQNTAP
jgi:hypothetical protein